MLVPIGPDVVAEARHAVAEARQPLHVHHFLVVGAVVVHHREQRDPVLRRGPQHAGRVHQVAVALDVTEKRPCFALASAAPTAAGAP